MSNYSALALPPFKPPNLPRATAAGFFSGRDSPVASLTIEAANMLISVDFFSYGHAYSITAQASGVKRVKNQNDPLPIF